MFLGYLWSVFIILVCIALFSVLIAKSTEGYRGRYHRNYPGYPMHYQGLPLYAMFDDSYDLSSERYKADVERAFLRQNSY